MQEISLVSLFSALLRRKVIVVACIFVASTIGFVLTKILPKQYGLNVLIRHAQFFQENGSPIEGQQSSEDIVNIVKSKYSQEAIQSTAGAYVKNGVLPTKGGLISSYVIWGNDLKSTHAVAQQMVADLNAEYDELNKSLKDLHQSRLENTATRLKDMNHIAKGIEQKSFSALESASIAEVMKYEALAKEMNGLENKRTNLQLTLLKSKDWSNYKIISATEMGRVAPRERVIMLASLFLGIAFALLVVILLESKQIFQ